MRAFEGFMKGVDLGGWLSQCGNHYNEEHYSTFITEKDIETIAGWGADHVRLPIDYNILETEEGEFLESGFAHVDDCIRWCKKHGLKVVLDLHKTRGFVFDDESYVSFFEEKPLQDQFVDLWLEMNRRYGDMHDMLVFELLNEITSASMTEKWNEIADRTIKAIRKKNKDIRIIIGGIYNNSITGLSFLRAPQDENIVFTFHCYSPMIFTHQNAYWVAKMPKGYQLNYPGTAADYRKASFDVFGEDYDGEFAEYREEMMNEKFFEHIFQPAIQVAEKYNVPLYCGEYGVIDHATPEDTVKWYRDIHAALDKYQIARSAWSYKKMDFGISDERLAGVLPEIIQCL